MLSYRHAFHAGNHADVLKHVVLLELLDHLARKDKPVLVVDTHAGAGLYALDEGYATKLEEHRGGVERLRGRDDLPEPVARYLALVDELNPDGALRRYPGSPWLLARRRREQDRVRLFELHSTDARLLEENLGGHGKGVEVRAGDGLAGLRAALPPPSRRGLVLIDPAYEVREEYARVVEALEDGLRRFATGTYALWYPVLARSEAEELPARLRDLGAPSWLDARLHVRGAEEGGLTGSGLFIVNPPWTLPETLAAVLPWLARVLAQDEAAGWDLEHHLP